MTQDSRMSGEARYPVALRQGSSRIIRDKERKQNEVDPTTEDAEGVSYDEIQGRAEKLALLLKERETGHVTWHGFLHDHLKWFHDIYHLVSPESAG